MSIAQELKETLARFGKARIKYRSYGAADGEPGWVFRDLLKAALEGDEVRVPGDGEGWQLYSASMDCTAAALDLTFIALRAVNLIGDAPLREREAIQRVVEAY